ncbi:hypothetical protein EON83_04655 [bacterium]|nr:MAG: hypothetical protein EON83_04655 [bacterium]
MLKNSYFARHRVVTVATLLGLCCSSSSLYAQENPYAQEKPTTPPATESNKQLQELAPGTNTPIQIRVRNIKPSLIAYWLDSANHQMPVELKVAQAFGMEGAFQDLPRLPGNANGPAELKLPQGITRLVAIDPQNTLLAFGTKEGLQALADLIPTLDVPLVQYEVEALFLQIPRSQLASTGLKFKKPMQKSPYYFGAVTLVPASFNIPNILKEKDVKILTAPRVTAIDGLTAQLQQITQIPFVMDLGPSVVSSKATIAPTNGLVQESAGSLQSIAFLSTNIGIKATPHQNKSELISLSITPVLGTRTVSVAATVNDGQSFAIQMAPANEDKQVIVIVTPRRIRRVGDK